MAPQVRQGASAVEEMGGKMVLEQAQLAVAEVTTVRAARREVSRTMAWSEALDQEANWFLCRKGNGL